jgi:MFS family permease
MAKHASTEHDREAPAAPAGRSPLETVVVHGSDISVRRAYSEVPLAEARSRFGGVDVPAILGGALAGLGTAAILGGLASAIGLTTGQADGETLAYAALATSLVVVALSALLGGWAAGRMSRFDGARNGLLAGLLLALLLALMGAAGAYSAAEGGLPVSLDGDRLTTAAIVAAVAALVVSALAGAAGGRLGTRWHRDVDDVLVGTRPGSVTATSQEVPR